MRIAVLMTGGTASCELAGTVAHLSSPKPVKDLFLRQAGEDRLSFLQPFDRLSEDVGPEQWLELSRVLCEVATSHDGAVVVHGTDTMPYAAGATALLTRHLGIPVVFTGSMLPSGSPDSDLPGNIGNALSAVRALPAGCYLAFHDRLHLAAQCRKDLSRAECFTSLREPLGYAASPVMPGEVRAFDDNVLQLRLYPGMPLGLILEAALSSSGVVVELYASGTAPSLPGCSLVDFVSCLYDHGIPVCLTRPWPASCFDYPAWPLLLEAGAIDLADCFTEFATVKLMWALAQPSDTSILMQSSICGELDSIGILERSKSPVKSFSLQNSL